MGLNRFLSLAVLISGISNFSFADDLPEDPDGGTQLHALVRTNPPMEMLADFLTKKELELGADKFVEYINAESFGKLTAAMEAARVGNVDNLIRLRAFGAKLEKQDSVGRNVIHFATWGHLFPQTGKEGETAGAPPDQKIEMIQYLVRAGVNVDSQDFEGLSPLMFVSMLGDELSVSPSFQVDTLRLLIDLGANVELQDKQGETALIKAARLGRDTVVDFLLKSKAHIDHQNIKGSTALLECLARGQESTARLLINNNSNLNLKDHDGESALAVAAKNLSTELIAELIQCGANVNALNSNGIPVFNRAIESENGDKIEFFLRQDKVLMEATPEVPMSVTPLQALAETWLAQYIPQFLQKGSKLDTRSKTGSALHHAATKLREDMAEALIRAGADINLQNEQGQTPVMLVVQAASDSIGTFPSPQSKLLEKLFNYSANPNIPDHNGQYPVLAAFQNPDKTLAFQIVNAPRTNLNVTSPKGDGPLHYLIRLGEYWTLSNIFENKRGNIHLRGAMGRMPIHVAIADGDMNEESRVEFVQMFLKFGADPRIKDDNGSDAFALAEENKFEKVLAVLKEHEESKKGK